MAKRNKQHSLNKTSHGDREVKIFTQKKTSRHHASWSIMIIPGCIILLRYFLSFFPDERVWGLNHLGFMGKDFALIFSILCLILLSPQVFSFFTRIRVNGFTKSSSIVLFVASVIIGVMLIVFFPVRGYFLGDGFSYTAELYRYLEHAPFDSWLLFSSSGSAPATGYLYAFLGKAYFRILEALYPTGSAEMADIWIIGGILSAIFFIPVIFRLVKIIKKHYDSPPGIVLISLAFLVLIPGTVFYFGYVEYYVFAYTAMVWFIVIGLRFIYSKSNGIVLILLFIITSAFHISGLILLPALIFLLLTSRNNTWDYERIKKTLLYYSFITLAGTILFYIVYGTGKLSNRFMMPLLTYHTSSGTQSYTLFSSYNAFDTINILLFLTASPMIIWLTLLIKRYSGNVVLTDTALKNHTRAKGYAGILLISFTALVLFGNSAFGKARDWDIYVALSFPAGLYGMLLFVEVRHDLKKYVGYATLIVAAHGFIPWMYCNLSQTASERYFRSVIQLDEYHVLNDYALNGYEHLRKAYFSSGDKENALWAMKKKIELIGYPIDFRWALSYLVDDSRRDKREIADFLFAKMKLVLSEIQTKKSDEIHPGYKRNLYLDLAGEFLFKVYHRVDKSLAKQYAEKLKEQISEAVQLQIIDAEELSAEDKKYLEIYSAIGAENSSSPELAYQSGLCFVINNRYQDAVKQLRFCQKLDPKFNNAKFLSGVSYYNLRNTIQARNYFIDYMKSETNRSNPLLKEAEGFARKMVK